MLTRAITPRRRRARSTPPGPRRPRNPARWVFPTHGDRLARLTAAARRHGGAARLPHGPVWIYLFTEPELVRETLVTRAGDFTVGRKLAATREFLGDGLLGSGGETHRRQRRVLQPAFHGEAVAGYVALIADRTERALAGWRVGSVRDVREEVTWIARDVMASVAWGEGPRGEDTPAGDLAPVMEYLERTTTPAGRIGTRLPTPGVLRARAAAARSRAGVEAAIARRRRDGGGGSDLVGMLLAATDEAGRPLPEALIADELQTLFLAGQESVANTLSWTLWLVFERPAVVAALREEADHALAGMRPTTETVGRLRMARRCVQEAMRLYPPAWAVGRTAVRRTRVGTWDVPRGANVLVSPWVTHRDPALWPDPLLFDPDRFAPAAERARPRFAYYPFGGGARTCIGAGLAMVEATIILAMVVRAFDLRWAGDGPPRPNPQITLRPEGGAPMLVRSR